MIILYIHKEIAQPTDIATMYLRISASICQPLITEACSAITKRAGSAMVVENQMRNQKTSIQKCDFFLANCFVRLFPIGKIQYSSHMRNTASHTQTIIIHNAVSAQLSGTVCNITN